MNAAVAGAGSSDAPKMGKGNYGQNPKMGMNNQNQPQGSKAAGKSPQQNAVPAPPSGNPPPPAGKAPPKPKSGSNKPESKAGEPQSSSNPQKVNFQNFSQNDKINVLSSNLMHFYKNSCSKLQIGKICNQKIGGRI